MQFNGAEVKRKRFNASTNFHVPMNKHTFFEPQYLLHIGLSYILPEDLMKPRSCLPANANKSNPIINHGHK